MDRGGGHLAAQVTVGTGEDSLISDLFVELEEDTSMDIPIPMQSTATVSFLTCDEARAKAMQMVDQMCEIVGAKPAVAEELLRKHRWDMGAALLQFTKQLESEPQQVGNPTPSQPVGSPGAAVKVEDADEIVPVTTGDVDEIVPVRTEAAPEMEPTPMALEEDDAHRTLKTVWRRITEHVACATCFEPKNGSTQLVFATDCGIVLCALCWGGYFRAEFSGGVRTLIRCPYPDCNSIVPLWLLEKCYESAADAETAAKTAAIMACYRFEFVSDFVFASDDIQFCPSPTCDLLVQLHGSGWRHHTVVCRCGYAFCFHCLNEAHFPAECQHAKEVATFLAQREMYRLADVFTAAKRCSYCGILIENEGGCDSFQCIACNHQLKWSAMMSCRESLAKACCSRFSKRSAAIERRLGDLLMWYQAMAKDLEESDRHLVVRGEIISVEKWEAYEMQTMRVLRLLKWTKVFFVLAAQGEQLDAGIAEKAGRLQVSVETFLTHLVDKTATLKILQSVQDNMQRESEDVRKVLEAVIRLKDIAQLT